MNNYKKADDELPVLLIVNGIFSLVLFLVDLFYSAFAEMSGLYLIFIVILHIGVAISWIVVYHNWKNPNFDWSRKLLIALIVVSIIAVGLHRAGVNEDRAMQEDADKAKQEQLQ